MSAVSLRSFGFGDQLVRAMDRDGVAWLVGNDVCAALELANTSQSLARLDDDERDEVQIVDPIGRKQSTTVISESGVYSLAFTSRKEAAKRFKRWVTHEVLPAIRATGCYHMAGDDDAASNVLAPGTPPDELEALTKKLAIAKEVRVAFGMRAARRAWRLLGILPELTADADERAMELLPIGLIANLQRSFGDWLDARTEAAPGARIESQALYRDYLDWSKREGFAPAEIVGQTAFGRALSNCGVAALKSGRVWRLGLKLVTTG